LSTRVFNTFVEDINDDVLTCQASLA